MMFKVVVVLLLSVSSLLGGPPVPAEVLLDAIYIPLESKICEGRNVIGSIGSLRGTLLEFDLFDEALERSERLVAEYGAQDPTLYFLLMESPKTNEVRVALMEDFQDFEPASRDQALSLDFLKMYFSIPGTSAVSRAESKESPVSVELEVERGNGAAVAVVTLRNLSGKGRFVMVSPDARDYLGLERVDGVVVPVARRKAPVTPMYLGPGESAVKRCSLKSVTKKHFNQSSRWKKYPFDDPPKGYTGDASTILWWVDVPHVALNGDLIGFGDAPIPVRLFARYDEERMFARVAANNFDPARMPWTNRESARAFYEKMERNGTLIPEEKRGWKRDWYPEFILIYSEPLDWALGGGLVE